MAGLLDLPQQIDAAINGIVSFGYRVATTWFQITIHPLRGPLRLASSTKSASSRTLLFVASAVFITSGGGSNLILPVEAASGAGLEKVGKYLLGVILCFLIADGAVYLLSVSASGPGRRRSRAAELLRFALATAILNIAFASIIIETVNRLPENWPFGGLGPVQAPEQLRVGEGVGLIIMAAPLLGVLVTSFLLVRRRSKLLSALTALPILLTFYGILVVRTGLVPSPPRETEGWEETDYLYCKNVGDGVIEVHAIFHNGHGHEIILGRDDWLLTGDNFQLTTVEAIEPPFVKIAKHSDAEVLLRFRAAPDQIEKLDHASSCWLKLSMSPDDPIAIDASDDPHPGVDGRIIQTSPSRPVK